MFCALHSAEGKIIKLEIEKKISSDLFGKSTNLFVGSYSYPFVSAGPLVSIDDSFRPEVLDNPTEWIGKGFAEIISLRANLARGQSVQNVKTKTRTVQDMQDLVLSERAIDVEAKFDKAPVFSIHLSPILQPMGPTANLIGLRLAENPKIPKKIDSIVNDNVTVATAMPELVQNYDLYYVQKLFNSGLLGRKKDKKLVPTRWSITATDDMIAKHLLESIRTFDELNGILLFSNNYLYNNFDILMLPGKWEFEQFEAWQPSSNWNFHSAKPLIEYEYEPFEGRTNYAESEGGGYYAGRLAVVEKLHEMRKQARVIVFREISEQYTMPVGVWQVRENARQALKQSPIKFQSKDDALSFLKAKLKNPFDAYQRLSRILTQRKIFEF